MKRPRQSGSLGRDRLTVYIVGIGAWLSGALWLLFHYLFVQTGEFGPNAHPLEPWWLKLHGAFAFAAIWIFGLLWGTHVSKLWPTRRRRWSGAVMTAVFLWLILSGYLLYYVGSEIARPMISLLHWTVGLACPVPFLWHRFNWLRRGSGKRIDAQKPIHVNQRVGTQ